MSKPMDVKGFSAKVAEIVQTRYRVPGNGQLEEQARFLVSRGLTLPFSPP